MQGAVVVLKAPGYCIPEFRSFDAFSPRPSAVAYYDFYFYPDTDDDAIGEGISDDGGSSFTTGTAEEERGSEAMAEDDTTSCLAHDPVSPTPPQSRSPVAPSAADLSGLQVIGTSSPASLGQQQRDPRAAALEPATGADGCPQQCEPEGLISKGATPQSPPLTKGLQVCASVCLVASHNRSLQ